MNSQDLVMETIEARCDNADLVITIDYDYSNRGYIRALDPATLTAQRSLMFDFQTQKATFKLVGGEFFACHNYDERPWKVQNPVVKTTVAELIDAVVEYLKGGTS